MLCMYVCAAGARSGEERGACDGGWHVRDLVLLCTSDARQSDVALIQTVTHFSTPFPSCELKCSIARKAHTSDGGGEEERRGNRERQHT